MYIPANYQSVGIDTMVVSFVLQIPTLYIHIRKYTYLPIDKDESSVVRALVISKHMCRKRLTMTVSCDDEYM